MILLGTTTHFLRLLLLDLIVNILILDVIYFPCREANPKNLAPHIVKVFRELLSIQRRLSKAGCYDKMPWASPFYMPNTWAELKLGYQKVTW